MVAEYFNLESIREHTRYRHFLPNPLSYEHYSFRCLITTKLNLNLLEKSMGEYGQKGLIMKPPRGEYARLEALLFGR
jgi:hypothetical protein